ncbi:hypothetical protein PS2_034635 [Malus domestica]
MFNLHEEWSTIECSCCRIRHKYKNATFNCRIDMDSKVTGTLSMKFLSTTETAASFSLLEYKSGKLGFQTRQEYGAAALSVSLC